MGNHCTRSGINRQLSAEVHKGERSRRASLNKWIEGNRSRGKLLENCLFFGKNMYSSTLLRLFFLFTRKVNILIIVRNSVQWHCEETGCERDFFDAIQVIRMFALLHASRRHPIRERVWLLLQHWRAASRQCDIKCFCFLNRHWIMTKVPQSIQTHLSRLNATGVNNLLLQISSSKGRNP